MKDFNVEEWDARYRIYVEQSIGSTDYDSSSTGKIHFKNTCLKTEMLFTTPVELDTVEAVALMYYQFDKFMKEHYGETINAYQEMMRAKRIE